MLVNFSDIFAPSLTNRIKITGKGELMCFCPFHVHTYNTPSMSVNQETGKWKCFACNESGGYVSYYSKTRGISISQALKDLDKFDEDYKNKPIVTQISEEIKEIKSDPDYTDYIVDCWNKTILHEKNFSFYGQKLYELRGITLNTAVACCISYDPQKGWLFPIRRYKGNGTFCGYEVRKKDFTKFSGGNKCFRGEGSPKCLSVIYEPVLGSNKAIICEGYIDSIFMYQYLFQKLGEVNKTIMTPSHGVSMLPELIEELKLWNDFKEVLFALDNDEAGNKAKQVIKDLGHNDVFKYFNELNEGEDLEDWYKRR